MLAMSALLFPSTTAMRIFFSVSVSCSSSFGVGSSEEGKGEEGVSVAVNSFAKDVRSSWKDVSSSVKIESHSSSRVSPSDSAKKKKKRLL